MKNRYRPQLCAVLATAAFTAHLSFSQTSQGVVTGVARDSGGAVIPGAKVTITNEETGEMRQAATKADGSYRLDAIPRGRYTLVFTVAGFDTRKATGVIVNPSVITSYDASLVIGKVNDVVEIKAVSNAIKLENGQLTGVISANDLHELPIFSLNPFELATTL